jgi:hypothetical protein
VPLKKVAVRKREARTAKKNDVAKAERFDGKREKLQKEKYLYGNHIEYRLF